MPLQVFRRGKKFPLPSMKGEDRQPVLFLLPIEDEWLAGFHQVMKDIQAGENLEEKFRADAEKAIDEETAKAYAAAEEAGGATATITDEEREAKIEARLTDLVMEEIDLRFQTSPKAMKFLGDCLAALVGGWENVDLDGQINAPFDPASVPTVVRYVPLTDKMRAVMQAVHWTRFTEADAGNSGLASSSQPVPFAGSTANDVKSQGKPEPSIEKVEGVTPPG